MKRRQDPTFEWDPKFTDLMKWAAPQKGTRFMSSSSSNPYTSSSGDSWPDSKETDSWPASKDQSSSNYMSSDQSKIEEVAEESAEHESEVADQPSKLERKYTIEAPEGLTPVEAIPPE